MPNLLNTLGKVFAIRRKRPPATNHSSIDITCPPQDPGSPNPTRIPNTTDPSNSGSCADKMREYGILALTMTAPLAESIPVVGSPLKAVVTALLEVLKVADRIDQNTNDIQNLRERLVNLQHHISMIPYANDPVICGLRGNLTNQLNGTLTRLESLRAMSRLRSSTIKQMIEQCSKDIEHYLQMFSTLTFMYISQRPTFTGVVLMDAIGKRHEMPMDFAGSYEIFADAIRLLFKNNTLEARLQQRYIQEGMYDLAIDGGDKATAINGQQDWSEVHPGTTIVMRVILLQRESTDVQVKLGKHQCPRCREWNYGPESSSSIDCRGCDGRFQISNASVEQVTEYGANSTSDQEMMLLRNFHLKKYHGAYRGQGGQPKSSRQQFSACGACRMRRIRCDLKDNVPGPCSNCKERGINCVDLFANVNDLEIFPTGRRLQQVEAIYGKLA